MHGDSYVILSTTATAAMLAVHYVQQCNVAKFDACKLCSVKLFSSRNTQFANNFFQISEILTRLCSQIAQFKHGSVVMCSVQWHHCT